MATTPTTTTAKKSTISKDLISKYGGASAAQAQGELDQLSSQRSSLQSQLDTLNQGMMGTEGGTQQQMQQREDLRNQIAGLGTNMVSAQGRVNNPLAGVDAKQKDIIKGAEFGEAVLGDGLGRAADNADIQMGMDQLREQSQGYSAGETLARREMAVENLNTSQQGQRRQLQASLARAGVRGGVAGAQLGQQATDSMSQRSNLERDLFVSGESARREGTQNLLTGAGDLQRFDLEQAAKEKNIVLQSGLGFAQLGAAERGAALQAQSSERAAAASRPSCHVAGTQVAMEDGTYKNIEDIKVGDKVLGGGKVKIAGVAEADDNIYLYNGEFVTGSHVVYSELVGKYVPVKTLNVELTNKPKTTLVYPLVTELGFYKTQSGAVHGDIFTEEYEIGSTLAKQKIERAL